MSKTYCQMTSLAGCAGGGWTMVMKVDGSQVEFLKTAAVSERFNCMKNTLSRISTFPERRPFIAKLVQGLF
jgi:hypothetical protein